MAATTASTEDLFCRNNSTAYKNKCARQSISNIRVSNWNTFRNLSSAGFYLYARLLANLLICFAISRRMIAGSFNIQNNKQLLYGHINIYPYVICTTIVNDISVQNGTSILTNMYSNKSQSLIKVHLNNNAWSNLKIEPKCTQFQIYIHVLSSTSNQIDGFPMFLMSKHHNIWWFIQSSLF